MTEYENMTSWECITVKSYTENSNTKQKVIVSNIYYNPYTTVDNFNIFLHEFASFIEVKEMEHKMFFRLVITI